MFGRNNLNLSTSIWYKPPARIVNKTLGVVLRPTDKIQVLTAAGRSWSFDWILLDGSFSANLNENTLVEGFFLGSGAISGPDRIAGLAFALDRFSVLFTNRYIPELGCSCVPLFPKDLSVNGQRLFRSNIDD
jgi:hypothetical protein